MTLQDDIDKIEEEIKDLEVEAVRTICNIVTRVEAVTGRPFQASISQAGISIGGKSNKTIGGNL